MHAPLGSSGPRSAARHGVDAGIGAQFTFGNVGGGPASHQSAVPPRRMLVLPEAPSPLAAVGGVLGGGNSGSTSRGGSCSGSVTSSTLRGARDSSCVATEVGGGRAALSDPQGADVHRTLRSLRPGDRDAGSRTPLRPCAEPRIPVDASIRGDVSPLKAPASGGGAAPGDMSVADVAPAEGPPLLPQSGLYRGAGACDACKDAQRTCFSDDQGASGVRASGSVLQSGMFVPTTPRTPWEVVASVRSTAPCKKQVVTPQLHTNSEKPLSCEGCGTLVAEKHALVSALAEICRRVISQPHPRSLLGVVLDCCRPCAPLHPALAAATDMMDSVMAGVEQAATTIPAPAFRISIGRELWASADECPSVLTTATPEELPQARSSPPGMKPSEPAHHDNQYVRHTAAAEAPALLDDCCTRQDDALDFPTNAGKALEPPRACTVSGQWGKSCEFTDGFDARSTASGSSNGRSTGSSIGSCASSVSEGRWITARRARSQRAARQKSITPKVCIGVCNRLPQQEDASPARCTHHATSAEPRESETFRSPKLFAQQGIASGRTDPCRHGEDRVVPRECHRSLPRREVTAQVPDPSLSADQDVSVCMPARLEFAPRSCARDL